MKQAAEEARAGTAGSTQAKPAEPPNPAAPPEPEKSAEANPAKERAVAKPQEPNVPQGIIRGEARARFAAARNAEIGFVERLVWFWSNHLCVSSLAVPIMAGGYEREAIRPHVLGRRRRVAQEYFHRQVELVGEQVDQQAGVEPITGEATPRERAEPEFQLDRADRHPGPAQRHP